MEAAVDLLARPIYGMAQVDRLLSLKAGTARRWIDGYERKGRTYPPVVRPERTGDEVVTWGEFVETRLLAEYRAAGVPLLRLRPVVVRLRHELGTPHPLAHLRPWVADRELVAAVQEEVGLDRGLHLVELRTGQVRLTPPAERFVGHVSWGSDVAVQVRPLGPDTAVTIDPCYAFGEPAVRGIRTEVIGEIFRAGDSPAQIAERYSLTLAAVEDALRFELQRAAPAA